MLAFVLKAENVGPALPFEWFLFHFGILLGPGAVTFC